MIKSEQGRCAMEQEYRYLSCKKCDTLHKIEVLENDIGEVISVSCPTCGMVCHVIIWRRPNIDSLLENLINAALRDIKEGINSREAMKAMTDAGYKVKIGVVGDIEQIPLEQLPTPIVVNGEIEQGTFNEYDLKFLDELQSAFSARK